MSSSRLWRVYRTTATSFAEYGNSWGTAPPLWNHLFDRYVLPTIDERRPYLSWINARPEEMAAHWALVRDERVPVPVRLAFALTFDRGYCPADRLAELADALASLEIPGRQPGTVWHWPAIAEALRSHRKRARQLGVGLGCTSVHDPWSYWNGDRSPQSVFDLVTAQARAA